ncbi:hypothetical protein [Komagataeibacter sp. FNDCR2]|uniref:hypothetical protein n=1 Tax=Komagataeibacter sp. FNDCR2 TaxID=2878682 RepID=UPI001E335C97|nr:hypothetical protein [Komagataeibacter sp. FNDCR2]MCE2574839.1 hypothetical protein [Komagataeibacter sp. FNDCR2]
MTLPPRCATMWLLKPTMEEPVEKRIADLEAKVEALMARKETYDAAIEMEVEIINRLVDMVALLIFHQPPSVKRDVLNAWRMTDEAKGAEKPEEEKPEWYDASLEHVRKTILDAAAHSKLALLSEAASRAFSPHRFLR